MGSLLLSGGSTWKINHGAGSGVGPSIDDVAESTIMAWVYQTSAPAATEQKICQKGTGGEDGTYRGFSLDAEGGGLGFAYQRATTDLFVACTFANLPAYALNKWICVAVDYVATGANGDQLLFGGDETTDLAAVTSYTTQLVGSGAHTSDAAANFIAGNKNNNDHPFLGRMARLAVWCGRRLTLAEKIRQQHDMFPTVDCGLMSFYGYDGTGSQRDWTGNGNTGTITGATLAVGPRLLSPFERRNRVWTQYDAAAVASTRRGARLLRLPPLGGGLVRCG